VEKQPLTILRRNYAPQVKQRLRKSSMFTQARMQTGGLFNTVAVNSKVKRRGRRNERQMLLRRNKEDTMRLHDEGRDEVF
jgi:hypothetical protein